MGPCVGSDLVTLRVHTFDNGPILVGDIDLSLVDVVASDKERSLCVVAFEKIENVVSKGLLWTIVICESNGSVGYTSKDASATVCDRSNLVARDRRGVGTTGGPVLGAAWSKVELASRGVTEGISCTTVCY